MKKLQVINQKPSDNPRYPQITAISLTSPAPIMRNRKTGEKTIINTAIESKNSIGPFGVQHMPAKIQIASHMFGILLLTRSNTLPPLIQIPRKMCVIPYQLLSALSLNPVNALQLKIKVELKVLEIMSEWDKRMYEECFYIMPVLSPKVNSIFQKIF